MAYDLSQASVTGPRNEIFMLVHGSAGVGKTTLAASIPGVFFIRTEDGTGVHEVPTYPIPKTYDEVMAQLVSFNSDHNYKALVIDSIDHLEPLIWQKTCKENGWKDIEAPGYGKGYIAAMIYWREFIGVLNQIREEKKMHIVLIAHNELKPFRDPELEPVDAYFIKLQKHASAFVKESCDAVLYAKQKIVVVKDAEGFNKTRSRGKTTGVRCLMTQPHPGYEAKNRYGLPAELPLDWSELMQAIKQPKKDKQANA